MPKVPIKIVLDEEDFKCLVRGGILKLYGEKNDVQIILQDIGFSRMQEAIEDAERKGSQIAYTPHERRLIE